MKNHPVTIRFSDEEFNELQQKVNLENTTVSQYVREYIKGVPSIGGKDIQIAATKLCEIYIELSKLGLDKNEDIMKGIDRLCRKLY